MIEHYLPEQLPGRRGPPYEIWPIMGGKIEPTDSSGSAT